MGKTDERTTTLKWTNIWCTCFRYLSTEHWAPSTVYSIFCISIPIWIFHFNFSKFKQLPVTCTVQILYHLVWSSNDYRNRGIDFKITNSSTIFSWIIVFGAVIALVHTLFPTLHSISFVISGEKVKQCQIWTEDRRKRKMRTNYESCQKSPVNWLPFFG